MQAFGEGRLPKKGLRIISKVQWGAAEVILRERGHISSFGSKILLCHVENGLGLGKRENRKKIRGLL